MSTVLWANVLVDGRVTCQEVDHYALYRFSKKLDRLTRELGVTPFLDVQDTTDARFNLGDGDLPQGMESTDELMAAQGHWIDTAAAIDMLEQLHAAVQSRRIRFGVFSDAHDDVVAELASSLDFFRAAKAPTAQCNFAVVT